MTDALGAGRTVRVAVVGGGLAGLAATVALAEAGLAVELFESRRRLGGRATSFRDAATGDLVDHCQHVALGCCTNFFDFCRRTGSRGLFRRDRTLHFFGPDGSRHDFRSTPWLPAPLHLAFGLGRLGYLSRAEQRGIARAIWRLARTPADPADDGPTAADWLRSQGQSERAIEQFWSVVLVSALSETLDRVSLRYARKVIVDGFLAHRRGWEIEVPRAPLGELYGTRLERWLANRGVAVHLGLGVQQVEGDAGGVSGVVLADGSRREFDFVVVAVPWRRCRELFSPPLLAVLPQVAALDRMESAPITAVHLWFDCLVTPLPHAVLVGRIGQWVFNHGRRAVAAGTSSGTPSHHYQVVISASRHVAGRDQEELVAAVRAELASLWPLARTARLLEWRVVTEQHAVFSVRPGADRLRPEQKTPVRNLMLAGDWTDTGWPATMEGAVRSGYRAAEEVLTAIRRPRRVLVADLPRALLARLLLGSG